MNKHTAKFIVLLALALIGNTASAHTGSHEVSGFFSGISHPFLGLDHLLVMLGVGLWASRLSRTQAGLTVAAFLGFMVIGAGLAMLGFAVEGVEAGILGSVLFVGLLLVLPRIAPPILTVCLLASFAILHGFAHGLEMPSAFEPVHYALGFLLATAILHGIGLGLGALLHKHPRGLQALGFLTSGLGLWLLVNA